MRLIFALDRDFFDVHRYFPIAPAHSGDRCGGLDWKPSFGSAFARGKPVVALIRPKRDVTSHQRIEKVLKPFEDAWECKLPRPILVDGDLRQRGLGLSPKDLEWVRQHCASVIHLAASLSFRPAEESKDNEPYLTNVEGTRNLLEVCQSADISEFHYTSTAYVCGDRDGRILESDLQCGQSFANDYEQSKVQAEQLLRGSLPGKQLTVYRPSIVIDTEHLSPPSSDRTLHVALSLYQATHSRMGLTDDVRWFEFLGMTGDEYKNIVEASWVAEVIDQAINTPSSHGRTYHLTASSPATIGQIEAGFRQALIATSIESTSATTEEDHFSEEWLTAIAGPYVAAFEAYFRSDPDFDQTAVNDLAELVKLSTPPTIDAARIGQWAERQIEQQAREKAARNSATNSMKPVADATPSLGAKQTHESDEDPIVIVGSNVRLPGAEGGLDAFADLLFAGRSAVTPLPPERLDKDLYLDARRGTVGATYTTLGSCVREDAFGKYKDAIDRLGKFDLSHRHFAEVAAGCFESFGGDRKAEIAGRCGVFVGHSGGTQLGGPTTLATLAETVTARLLAGESFKNFSPKDRKELGTRWADALRQEHSQNSGDANQFNAYSTASLTARLLGLGGPRVVVDAACASSLLALEHAILAIRSGHIDSAIVGSETFNHVDNLILFSQSQACSDTGSAPFDESANGLVSSEGYVAIGVTRKSYAIQHGLPIQAVVCGIGVASDGRGKSLWAPRSEGQQLAMRRGYERSEVLDVDYQEAHATSTQVGDATELTSLAVLLDERVEKTGSLKIGSVKSNFGHTLEAAGLVGLVKVLLAMNEGRLPPTINLHHRTSFFDWSSNQLEPVTQVSAWPRGDRPRRAAVNAFGIGGLNAHLVVEQFEPTKKQFAKPKALTSKPSPEPIAIVARGVVLAGVNNVSEFSALLRSDRTAIGPPPKDRWFGDVAVGRGDPHSDARTPTNHGGYIHQFHFNGQPYRIPPKQVSLANPVQMMLIDAVNQAAMELDGGKWDIDRSRAGVVVGTIFGGEFANELLVGLKAPEILSHLRQLVDCDSADAAELIAACREDLLNAYPAILDETGSFTSSTLASRIVKTFDLMGGACAVDSDEAASGTALMLAASQLNQGKLDLAICGAAERALDIVAFERIDRKGRLTRSGQVEDIAGDGSKILPGEGCAVVMLQRLSDAQRQGRKIYGLIDQVDCGLTDDPDRTRSQQFSTDPVHHQVFSRVGSLFGAHTLVQMVAKTCLENNSRSIISSTAEDGFYVNVHLSPAEMLERETVSISARETVSVKTTDPKQMMTLRLEAKTKSEFSQLLRLAERIRVNRSIVSRLHRTRSIVPRSWGELRTT